MRGRVQGVGYRDFVQRAARQLGLIGQVRNLSDGRVEVYTSGPADRLEQLAALLWKGPCWADVRGVEETEATQEEVDGFRIG